MYHQPIFTQEQLSGSIQATQLMEPILHASVIMDQEQLNSDILLALPNDPLYSSHLKDPKPHWSVSLDGFLHHNNLIYIPDSGPLAPCFMLQA